MKHRYKYEGPVLVNSNVVAIRWKGEAVADNEKLAKRYIQNSFLKENNIKGNPRVYLPKELIKMEAIL